jgi:D-lactate dehydrogenase
MKTLVYSSHGFDQPFLQKFANSIHEIEFTEEALNETTAQLSKGFEAVALFSSDKANAAVLEILKQNDVNFIALRSVGYDHVDLNKAQSLGIKVANIPEYSPYAIAEHAVTLLLALNRKVILANELMKTNNFRLDQLVGFDLQGKTVGIVGTGKIGSAFTRIMNGFGCKLLGYDIAENTDLIAKTNIQYTSLEELCKQSDVISVCCPLNEATKYMFNKATFELMKKGVYFINTARGGIVNTFDLIEAIENKTIAAAGLDVYENENGIFFKDLSNKVLADDLFEKLRSYPNVLITGHQAFLTQEALTSISQITMENLSNWEQFGKSPNDLN